MRICLSANMISVPFCNPPTDHDFPRKWFKLLGRDRKRREHDHDSRSLCLFARCKRAFISREDASVLTLSSSGKVSLFSPALPPHIQSAFSSSLLTMGLVWNSALTLDVRAACTLLTTAEKVAARHRSSHGSTALQRGGGGSETAAGSHTTAARWSRSFHRQSRLL